MNEWKVTYEVFTPDDAEFGDTDNRGFLCKDAGFETAIRAFGDGYIEPSCSDVKQARWFTVYGEADYRDGSQENRSLHIPERVSPAARIKLYYWLQKRR